MRGIYAGARSVLAAINPTGADTGRILPLLTSIDPTLGLEDQATTVCNLVEDEATLSAFRTFCNDSLLGPNLDRPGVCYQSCSRPSSGKLNSECWKDGNCSCIVYARASSTATAQD
jgi:hypothetical protein